MSSLQTRGFENLNGYSGIKREIISALIELDGEPSTASEIKRVSGIEKDARGIRNRLDDLVEGGVIHKKKVGGNWAYWLTHPEPDVDDLVEYLVDLDRDDRMEIIHRIEQQEKLVVVDLDDPDSDRVVSVLPHLDTTGVQRVKGEVGALIGDRPGYPGVRDYFRESPAAIVFGALFLLTGAAGFMLGLMLILLFGAGFLGGNAETELLVFGTVLMGIGLLCTLATLGVSKYAGRKFESEPQNGVGN